jgi:hypothetical protein
MFPKEGIEMSFLHSQCPLRARLTAMIHVFRKAAWANARAK